MSLEAFAPRAAAVLVLMTALWIVSVVKRDASIVDPWWSMGFLLVYGVTLWGAPATPGKLLLLAAVALWALRLWLYLLARARGAPEDPRYQAFRRRFGPERYWWVSFFQVFLLQGALVLVISTPLQAAGAAPGPDPLGWNDWAGLALFAAGFAFEAVGDRQLARFKADPASRGQVMDRGLWRYTRHPNYFGEAVLWWGFFLMAADAPGAIYTAFAPALMTFLLLRVSGVSMLEPRLRAAKPGYAEYERRTPAFFPRFRSDGEKE